MPVFYKLYAFVGRNVFDAAIYYYAIIGFLLDLLSIVCNVQYKLFWLRINELRKTII